MNKNITLLVSLCMALGCTKQNDPTPSMTATINNAAFSTLGSGVKTTGTQNTMATVIASNLAVNGSPVATTITITVFDSVGTYAVNSAGSRSMSAYISSSATGSGLVPATSGKVTVTSSTAHYFQGTFSLIFTDTANDISATNGQFTGTY